MRKTVSILLLFISIAATQSCSQDDVQENMEAESLNSKLSFPDFHDIAMPTNSCYTPTEYYIVYEGNYTMEEKEVLKQIAKEAINTTITSISSSSTCLNKETWVIPKCDLFAQGIEHENVDTNGHTGGGSGSGDGISDGDIGGAYVGEGEFATPPPGSKSITIKKDHLKLILYADIGKLSSSPCIN